MSVSINLNRAAFVGQAVPPPKIAERRFRPRTFARSGRRPLKAFVSELASGRGVATAPGCEAEGLPCREVRIDLSVFLTSGGAAIAELRRALAVDATCQVPPRSFTTCVASIWEVPDALAALDPSHLAPVFQGDLRATRSSVQQLSVQTSDWLCWLGLTRHAFGEAIEAVSDRLPV